MKKFVFAALAILAVVLGTPSVSTPAHAAVFHPPCDGNQ